MLVIDPARRLSMREIITHKWMKMDGEDEEFNKLIQVLDNLGFIPLHLRSSLLRVVQMVRMLLQKSYIAVPQRTTDQTFEI